MPLSQTSLPRKNENLPSYKLPCIRKRYYRMDSGLFFRSCSKTLPSTRNVQSGFGGMDRRTTCKFSRKKSRQLALIFFWGAEKSAPFLCPDDYGNYILILLDFWLISPKLSRTFQPANHST